MIWTAEMLDRAKALRLAGMSASRIAAELSTTRNAVLGKLWRQGHADSRGTNRQGGIYTEGLFANVDPEMLAALRKVAREQDASVSEKVRQYVDWGLEAEGVQ